MEQPTPLATRPTLFSTFTCRQTGTRVTGPTEVWPPRVRWTRDDNSISGDTFTRVTQISMHFVPSLFVFVIVAAFITQ